MLLRLLAAPPARRLGLSAAPCRSHPCGGSPPAGGAQPQQEGAGLLRDGEGRHRAGRIPTTPPTPPRSVRLQGLFFFSSTLRMACPAQPAADRRGSLQLGGFAPVGCGWPAGRWCPLELTEQPPVHARDIIGAAALCSPSSHLEGGSHVGHADEDGRCVSLEIPSHSDSCFDTTETERGVGQPPNANVHK